MFAHKSSLHCYTLHVPAKGTQALVSYSNIYLLQQTKITLPVVTCLPDEYDMVEVIPVEDVVLECWIDRGVLLWVEYHT